MRPEMDREKMTSPVKKRRKNYPVMKAKCATCPFQTDEQGRFVSLDIATSVQMRLFDTSQLCHHPRLSDRKETHICRGARDFQLTIFSRLGIIDAPTDAAWTKKSRELEAL